LKALNALGELVSNLVNAFSIIGSDDFNCGNLEANQTCPHGINKLQASAQNSQILVVKASGSNHIISCNFSLDSIQSALN
jgi:hypothetical protein